MKLIHLSDLHFGTETLDIVEQLRSVLVGLKPDLVVVSGDFTQIASTPEFKTARDFLKSLPAPSFCVPGNHDIPRYHLRERFFNPYKKYKEYIGDDLCPVYEGENVIIAGINTARRVLPHWNWANGAISQAQLDHLKTVYESSKALRRICVFHHPIQEALSVPLNTVVFGAEKARHILNELKVDLVLTGHVHHASITTLGDIDHKTVYLSASTALSSRLREQENGFNVIGMGDESGFEIQTYVHDGRIFATKDRYEHKF